MSIETLKISKRVRGNSRAMRVTSAVKILGGQIPRRRRNQDRSFESLYPDAELALECFRVLWKEKRKAFSADPEGQRLVNRAWESIKARIDKSIFSATAINAPIKRDRREYMRSYYRKKTNE